MESLRRPSQSRSDSAGVRPSYFRIACKIGIGSAVTRRPLPHHRAAGPYTAVRVSYANTHRSTSEARAILSRHWKAPQKGPWPLRGTTGHDRYWPYCGPVAAALPKPTERPRRRRGVFHCRHKAARSRSRIQRVTYSSTTDVSQKPK
jgi:hypothetical protein